MQSRQSRWPWVLVAVAVAAAGWWLFRSNLPQPAGSAAVTAPANPAPPPAAPPAGPAQDVPARHPLALEDAADAAIPALADSDAEAWSALQALVGDDGVLAVLLREHLIERVVVMVDNLPQRRIPRQALAMQPLPGELQVQDGQDGQGGGAIADRNAERYRPYVQAFTRVDPSALAAAYKRFYPLFQQAYEQLGYPDRYFNDRVVEVIDHLLQAPAPAAPLAVEPDGRGKYRFVDPSLEALSVGQKALVRLGPEQQAQVKAQLRAIRAALANG